MSKQKKKLCNKMHKIILLYSLFQNIAIAWFSSKTNKISNLYLAASEEKELKKGSCKSQNRKLSYSSFFSA